MNVANNLQTSALRRVTEASDRSAQARAEQQRAGARRSGDGKPDASAKMRPVRLLDVTA